MPHNIHYENGLFYSIYREYKVIKLDQVDIIQLDISTDFLIKLMSKMMFY